MTVLVELVAGTVKLSDEDRDYACMNMHISNSGYPIVMARQLHRIVVDRMGWCVPRKHVIDHINGDKLDARRTNLRVLPHKYNCVSRHSVNTGNTSGYLGVSYRCTTGGLLRSKDYTLKKPWVAGVCLHGVRLNLGCYATKEEAATAYAVIVELVYGMYAPKMLIPDELRSAAAATKAILKYKEFLCRQSSK